MPRATSFEIRFHHVGPSMADLDAQQRWYQQALGLHELVEQFELPEPPVRTVVLRAANGARVELIELIQPPAVGSGSTYDGRK